MRTRDRAAADSSAACLDKDGEPGLPAAAGVSPIYSAGAVRRCAVRFAAALPPAPAPVYRCTGHSLLPDCGWCGLSVSAAAGRRGTARLHGAGRRGRRGAVFLRLFPAAAACVDFLGGYPGLLGVFAVFSADVVEKFLQKNGQVRKKSLLFCREMLYNKKNRQQPARLQKGAAAWQTRNTQKNSRAPGPVC